MTAAAGAIPTVAGPPALPLGLGVALTGTIAGGLTGLLWGGAVRVCLPRHVTVSINSLCHYFGQRPFTTGDHSRNPAWPPPPGAPPAQARLAAGS
jgi:stearoyl-CoA desaturase (delta-9 desaturase)